MNQRDQLSNENRRAFWDQAVQLLQEGGLTAAALRQLRSKPLLEEFKVWLRASQQENSGLILSESPVGEAIAYALNEWEALCVHITAVHSPALSGTAASSATSCESIVSSPSCRVGGVYPDASGC